MRLKAGRAFGALVLALAATTARAEVIQIKMEKLATARNGAWDVLIPANATKSVVLMAPGQVDYYCKFHPNMTGQISVSK